MESKQGFISARPQKTYTLHTTHSVFHRQKHCPPPPAKWKGKCKLGTKCNNKLIGARNFVSHLSVLLPIDQEGHGTLTASTAAGNFVTGANIFGNANGTASGMAPFAHLAIYKACSLDVCGESDILASMDTAMEDGVDVFLASLGGSPSNFSEDSVAIAAFAAMEKGIFVSCSADNGGPNSSTLANEFPWVLTVGASTIDQSVRAIALLGNGDEFDGESLYQPKDLKPILAPLIDPLANGNQTMAYCGPRSLNNVDVKGKVVLCVRGGGVSRIIKGQTVKDAGGTAMIPTNDEVGGYNILTDAHILPAAHVSYDAGQKIKSYINSSSNPKATIVFKGTLHGIKSAPMVASFSSRGPNFASPGILKPDIIEPGVSLIAAWYNYQTNPNPNTSVNFNAASGTSISCPHLSGIAALIKSAHPDWSPSAIMTSAAQTNPNGSLITDERLITASDIFAIGAGHVNASDALDPGLVYDNTPEDYITYLCGLGYTEKGIQIITKRNVSCNGKMRSVQEADLNYPSFSIQLERNDVMYSRIVTNVGEAESSYYLKVESVPGVDVVVNPAVLCFTEVKQKTKY